MLEWWVLEFDTYDTVGYLEDTITSSFDGLSFQRGSIRTGYACDKGNGRGYGWGFFHNSYSSSYPRGLGSQD